MVRYILIVLVDVCCITVTHGYEYTDKDYIILEAVRRGGAVI